MSPSPEEMISWVLDELALWGAEGESIFLGLHAAEEGSVHVKREFKEIQGAAGWSRDTCFATVSFGPLLLPAKIVPSSPAVESYIRPPFRAVKRRSAVAERVT